VSPRVLGCSVITRGRRCPRAATTAYRVRQNAEEHGACPHHDDQVRDELSGGDPNVQLLTRTLYPYLGGRRG
jgi:hypothetical protein